MKHLLIAVMLCLSLCSYAQNPAEDVLNNFVKNTEVKHFFKMLLNNEHHEDQQLTSSYIHYSFQLPDAFSPILNDVLGTLHNMKSQAYQYVECRAGDTAATPINISIDNGPYDYVSPRSERNSITICFHSQSDSLRRYANLITWENKNDSIEGSVVRIYGLDPARNTDNQSSRKLSIMGQVLDLGRVKLPKRITDKYMHQNISQKAISFTPNNTKKLHKQSEVNDADTIVTATDFIREFIRLYTLFTTVQGRYDEMVTFQNTILTRIDNLVRQHSDVLIMNKDEYTLCIKMLKSMKKEVRTLDKAPTKYYIDIIIKRLKRARHDEPQ